MKTILFTAQLAVLVQSQSVNLPIWGDLDKSLSPTIDSRLLPKTPPPANFRVPAEYEATAAVIVAQVQFSRLMAGITSAVINYGNASIWTVGGQAPMGTDPSKFKILSTDVNSVWARDYGPFGVDLVDKKVGIVDTTYRHYKERPDDDAFPTNLAMIQSFPVYKAPLILDGGNFMVDTLGNLFMTKRVYIWNQDLKPDVVDGLLKEYFGVKTVNSIEYSGYPNNPTDGTGHIDMFAKLLNDNTVLVSTSKQEPFKTNGQKAVDYFSQKIAPNGKPYKVLTVDGWVKQGVWYTYSNSLIVNDIVIIPSYAGYAEQEIVAKKAYEAGMPGIKVISVPSDDSIRQGGSVHCVTQQVPSP